jgi:serine phosphatase RsbU (regulator of sigma subunit)
MSSISSVLIVDDCPDDAQLIVLELRRAGYEPLVQRVDTREGLLAALSERPWDVIVSDYALPQFSALGALKALKERNLDVPFIIVSGAMTDVAGADAMKAGVHDYIMKNNLARLVPAIERELSEADQRRQRRQAQQALRDAEAQLRIARDIQQRLFPSRPPRIPGLDIGGASFPAEATSGDYYDYVRLPEGSLGLVVGDVSGHGFGPAILMAEVRAYLRALMQVMMDVEEILTQTNVFVTKDMGQERLVTLFLGWLNPRNRHLVYAAAGHSGYLLDSAGHRHMLEATSIPLGVDGEAEITRAPPRVLRPGDLLFLPTDGIMETASADGTQFGLDRTLDVVSANRHKPSQEIVTCLYEEVGRFAGGQPQSDDITAMIIKVAETH